MTKCKGCGITLQTTDPNLPGYTPKEGSDYCQRCFRILHYDDLVLSMRSGVDPDEVLRKVNQRDAVILWVVDLFDFEGSMIEGIQRQIPGKPILLVGTKRDLLPRTVSDDKIAQFVYGNLKDRGCTIQDLLITGKKDASLKEDLLEALQPYGKTKEVVVVGKVNAGKSTLLNRLQENATLTTSRYPGTTLDFNSWEMEGITFVDTPGIEANHSLIMEVKEEDLKTILPTKTLKPAIYQIKNDQSFACGGLVRIDLLDCKDATAVFYVSDKLLVHRSKAEKADELWKKQEGRLFLPVSTKKEKETFTTKKDLDKMDVAIAGLGWVSLRGSIGRIVVTVPKGTAINFRKAMI